MFFRVFAELTNTTNKKHVFILFEIVKWTNKTDEYCSFK